MPPKNDSDDYVGFAIYFPVPHLQLLFKTHSHSSIFSAEALAILYALEHILSKSITKSIIFTDSKSVTEALLSVNLAHSYNYVMYAIKQKLFDIKLAGCENTIVWIPAHTGILGNKTVDHLAKRAISTGKLSERQLPHSDFSIPRRKYIESSSNFLKIQGRHKGTKYFTSFNEITLKPWFHKLKFNRESITTCCRFRSRHYALNYSLKRCNLVSDPSCQCGFFSQDADHIFWNCPQYDTQRISLLKQLSRFKEMSRLYKIQDILTKPLSGVISVLLSFLKSCNLL